MELNILALFLVLFCAWFGGSLVSRIGYPAVLGELLIGILLGPAVFGLMGDGSWLAVYLDIDGKFLPLEIIGHLGVLLLMLYIGMEIDPKELGKASWTGSLAALGGFVTPFALGVVVVLAFGGTLVAALFVAIALGVTSLAVNSRIVMDLRILDTRIAHVMLAGALIADTLSLLVFAGLVPFHKAQIDGIAMDFTAVGMLAAKAVAFFVGTAVLGIWVFPAAARWMRRIGINSALTFFILLILIALLFGELADLAGLHAILGTFVAGLFLREGMLEPRMQRELNELVRIVAIGLLAPVFFVMTGFEVRFDVVWQSPWLLIAVCAVAMVGKIVGTALFYLPTGHGWREGLVIGLGSNGRGAVEIVLAKIGLGLGLIDSEMFSVLVIMAIVTTATVPVFLKLGTEWLRKRGELVRSADKRTGVIIIGASPLARALGRVLAGAHKVALIDSNPARVQAAVSDGLEAAQGNALDNEALGAAHAPEAGRLIAMTGNAEINVLAARHAKDVFLVPNLHVLALAATGADTETLEHLGASVLFNQSVNLSDWDRWLEHREATIERVRLGDLGPEEVMIKMRIDGHVLPLALERSPDAAGKSLIEPWRSGLAYRPGDTLIVARMRQAAVRTDRFDELVRTGPVLDIRLPLEMPEFFRQAAQALAPAAGASPEDIQRLLLEREEQGSTVLTPGLAVPHIILPGERTFVVLVARCLPGVKFSHEAEPVHAMFVLAGTQDERNFHLKALSAVAQIWQGQEFEDRWRSASGPESLRRLLLDAPAPARSRRRALESHGHRIWLEIPSPTCRHGGRSSGQEGP